MAEMNTQIFREYDIRGTVDPDLNDDVVRNIGRAFGTYMQERDKKTVSIARDCRLSSEHLRDVIVAGMLESGLNIIDLGLLPTGLFYFSLFNMDVDGGIMITGSHNPGDQNGFKVAFGKATIFGSEIQYLRSIIEQERFYPGEGSYKTYKGLVEDYYRFLRTNIKTDSRLQCGHGCGKRHGRRVCGPDHERDGPACDGAFLRDGRTFSQSPSGPDSGKKRGSPEKDRA